MLLKIQPSFHPFFLAYYQTVETCWRVDPKIFRVSKVLTNPSHGGLHQIWKSKIGEGRTRNGREHGLESVDHYWQLTWQLVDTASLLNFLKEKLRRVAAMIGSDLDVVCNMPEQERNDLLQVLDQCSVQDQVVMYQLIACMLMFRSFNL